MDDVLSLVIRARDEASGEVGKITKSLGGLHGAAGSVGSGLKAAGGAILSLGKVAAEAAAVGLTALASQFAFGARSLVEENQKMAQTAAAIRSTGGVAKVTAKQIEGMAASLRLTSGIDDQVTRSTANMLLTFTKVRNETGKGNDVFNQATRSAIDMSIALGTDASSSALQLGKALNDPIKGITALQRAGVTFTAQQKEQIKTLVEHGKTLDAQKIILKELNTEFGGSTVAYGNSAAGAVAKLGLAWGEVQKALAEMAMPALTAIANVLSQQVFPALEPVARMLGGFVSDILSEGGDLGVLADDFRELAAQGNPLFAALSPVMDQLLAFQRTAVGPLIEQLKALVPAFLDLTGRAAAFGAMVVKDVAPTVIDIATKLGDLATVIVTKVVPVILDFATRVWEGGLNKAIAAAGKLISATIGLLTDLVTWITGNAPLMDALRAAADAIGTAFGLAGDAVSATVDWLGQMGDKISANKALMGLAADLGTDIGAGFAAAWTSIESAWDWLTALVTGITTDKPTLDALSDAAQSIGDLFAMAGDAIRTVTGNLTEFGKTTEAGKPGFDLLTIFATTIRNLFREAAENIERATAGLKLLGEAIGKLPSVPGLGSFIGNAIPGSSGWGTLPGNPTGKATGGAVSAGQAYIVGERRPELFVPSTSGTILPGVPSGIQIGEVHIHTTYFAGSEAEARSFARQMWGYLEEEAFRRGRGLQPVRGGS